VTLIARLTSGNRVLRSTGAGSIAVAATGMATGRDPGLSVAFAIVGATLIGISAFAPGVIAAAAVDNATVTTAATQVVVDNLHPHPTTPRARKKVLSVISLVLLLGFSILVIAVVFVAFCVATFLILSGR
jgi:hypothetical protein